MRTHRLLLALVLLAACGRLAPGPAASDRALTETRPITDVPRRTIGFLDTGVWISNELAGGRASDVWREGDSVYVVLVRPENAPINDSPWYAFKVWADSAQTIDLRLAYEHGKHRYWPKVARAGGETVAGADVPIWSPGAWSRLDSADVVVDTVANTATLELRVGPDTLWVAGQELLTSAFFDRWTDSLADLPHVTRRTVATSPRGRPIRMLELGDPSSDRHVVIVSRQHPPEVTGTLALVPFIETLVGDSELAREFRRQFRIHVVPLMNPDGVDLGHWRHNTGGVDLNRDWWPFRQPETTAVAAEIRRILDRPGAELWFGMDFHSTQYDVFYTLERRLETDPPGLADPWIAAIEGALPDYRVVEEPSGLKLDMSRNWFYRAYGTPGLIYEVGDETPRPLIRRVAVTAAEATMRLLLDTLAAR